MDKSKKLLATRRINQKANERKRLQIKEQDRRNKGTRKKSSVRYENNEIYKKLQQNKIKNPRLDE